MSKYRTEKDNQPTLFDGWEDATPVGGNSTSLRSVSHEFDALFERLARSDFRRRFHLRPQDVAYVRAKGWNVLRSHAADFVRRRLAPAVIPNDGRQTPMRGHPVFVAQHATACCCRGCFAKWHHIPAGRELTRAEQKYAVDVLMEWIVRQMEALDDER